MYLSQGVVFGVGHVETVTPRAVSEALRPVEGGRLVCAVVQGRPVSANLVQETALQVAHHDPAARQFLSREPPRDA